MVTPICQQEFERMIPSRQVLRMSFRVSRCEQSQPCQIDVGGLIL